jgi:hypothetical protein
MTTPENTPIIYYWIRQYPNPQGTLCENCIRLNRTAPGQAAYHVELFFDFMAPLTGGLQIVIGEQGARDLFGMMFRKAIVEQQAGRFKAYRSERDCPECTAHQIETIMGAEHGKGFGPYVLQVTQRAKPEQKAQAERLSWLILFRMTNQEQPIIVHTTAQTIEEARKHAEQNLASGKIAVYKEQS